MSLDTICTYMLMLLLALLSLTGWLCVWKGDEMISASVNYIMGIVLMFGMC